MSSSQNTTIAADPTLNGTLGIFVRLSYNDPDDSQFVFVFNYVLLGLVTLFMIFAVPFVCARRHAQPLKSRSPRLVIFYMFVLYVLQVLMCLRFALNRNKVFPCAIYMAMQLTFVQLPVMPIFLRSWRIFFITRMNLAKIRFFNDTQEPPVATVTAAEHQEETAVTAAPSPAAAVPGPGQPLASPLTSPRDNDASISSTMELQSIASDTTAATTGGMDERPSPTSPQVQIASLGSPRGDNNTLTMIAQQRLKMLLSDDNSSRRRSLRILVARFLISDLFLIILFLLSFILPIIEFFIFLGIEQKWFRFDQGCQMTTLSFVIGGGTGLVYAALALISVLCIVRVKEVYGLRNEQLLLLLLWALVGIAYIVISFIPWMKDKMDLYFPLRGEMLIFMSTIDQFVCGVVPSIQTFLPRYSHVGSGRGLYSQKHKKNKVTSDDTAAAAQKDAHIERQESDSHLALIGDPVIRQQIKQYAARCLCPEDIMALERIDAILVLLRTPNADMGLVRYQIKRFVSTFLSTNAPLRLNIDNHRKWILRINAIVRVRGSPGSSETVSGVSSFFRTSPATTPRLGGGRHHDSGRAPSGSSSTQVTPRVDNENGNIEELQVIFSELATLCRTNTSDIVARWRQTEEFKRLSIKMDRRKSKRLALKQIGAVE